MSFKLKIGLLLALAILVSAAIPTLTIYRLYQLEYELAIKTKRNVDNFIAINSIKSSFIQYDNHINRYLLTRNPNWWREAKAVKSNIYNYYKMLDSKPKEKSEFQDVLKEIREKQGQYFKRVSRLIKRNNRNWDQLTRIYNTNVVTVHNSINTLITSKANAIRKSNIDLLKQQEDLMNFAIIAEMMFLPIMIFVAVIIYKSSVQPINSITKTVKGVRADEPESLKQMVTELDLLAKKRQPQDEIGHLLRTLRHLGKEVEEKTLELNELIITDEKTQLFNYRHFKEQLITEFARARRFSESLSLIMIDIDKFKHYNDTNGHLLGDEVLIKVAKLLKQECRETDIPARFGGEEFAALLPRTDSLEAFQVAERIRHSIQDSVFPNQEKQPGGNLTASLGVATFPIDADDAEALINAADSALYEAKDKGRNQVIAFLNLQS